MALYARPSLGVASLQCRFCLISTLDIGIYKSALLIGKLAVS